MLNLKIIIGSTRPGRAADLVAPWITRAAREHGAFDADVLDPRDWQLPVFGETSATLGDLAWWAAVLRRARLDEPLPPAIMRRHATEGARS
jgi:NAD(P)H-dependent FMN reductase